MRHAVICFSLCFTQQVLAASTPRDGGVFIRQSTVVFSEPVPISLYEDDLRGDYLSDGGRYAVTFNSLELGATYGDFSLSYFLREDYAFEFSEETFELIYRDKNRLPIDENREYALFLKAQHIRAEGWRLGYSMPLGDFGDAGIAVNYLQAEELLYGTVSGTVRIEEGDIDRGNLGIFYYYHEDYFLNRSINDPARGEGYSIDLNADLTLLAGLQLKLNFYDLLGRIHWRSAPYSDLKIESTSTYYDEEGYAHRNPTLSGFQRTGDFKQPLPLHYEFRLTQALPYRLSLAYDREQYDKVVFNRLFFAYNILQETRFITGYDFTAESTWLGLEAPGFHLVFATDDFSLVDSKTLVLRAGAHIRF